MVHDCPSPRATLSEWGSCRAIPSHRYCPNLYFEPLITSLQEIRWLSPPPPANAFPALAFADDILLTCDDRRRFGATAGHDFDNRDCTGSLLQCRENGSSWQQQTEERGTLVPRYSIQNNTIRHTTRTDMYKYLGVPYDLTGMPLSPKSAIEGLNTAHQHDHCIAPCGDGKSLDVLRTIYPKHANLCPTRNAI